MFLICCQNLFSVFILIKHSREFLSSILNIIATAHRDSVHSVNSPPLSSLLHSITCLFLALVPLFSPVSLFFRAPTTSGLGGFIWVLPPKMAHPGRIEFRWRWLCLFWKYTEITQGKSTGDKTLHASETFYFFKFYFPNSPELIKHV